MSLSLNQTVKTAFAVEMFDSSGFGNHTLASNSGPSKFNSI